MKVVKNAKKLYVASEAQPQIVKHEDGTLMFLVELPPVDEIVQKMNSPLLEDIFHLINCELMMRDSKLVQEYLP